MADREILVALPYDGGTAGVFRDAGGVWLTGALERRGGTGIAEGERAAHEGVPQGTVAGGLLPDGAARAVVLERRRAGRHSRLWERGVGRAGAGLRPA